MENKENKIRRTEMVFILDRSGSMGGLESDTIGGFNSMMAKQKKEPGEATVTTVLFDDRYELLHDRINIQDIAPITDKDYYVRGCTALLDAMGRTIRKIDSAQKHTIPEKRADQVIFVITTDGMENASREFRRHHIRKMVEEHQRMGWEFIFLGANIDAITTAKEFGIPETRAANYHADSKGTEEVYDAFNDIFCIFRRSEKVAPSVGAEWKEKLERDYSTRKPKR